MGRNALRDPIHSLPDDLGVIEMDLSRKLPLLLPRAILWAQDASAVALAGGLPLSPEYQDLAHSVGVTHPERIRVLLVDALPLPSDPQLREAALATGLMGPHMAGITLGYAVLIVRGLDTRRLLSHEFRHVAQYEQAGSIADFLPVYLQQVAQFGYNDAPFEVDARAHEILG